MLEIGVACQMVRTVTDLEINLKMITTQAKKKKKKKQALRYSRRAERESNFQTLQ